MCAAIAYGVPKNILRSGVRAFRGVPNRLELICTLRGVRFYNDTTATTPEAAIAALRTLGQVSGVRFQVSVNQKLKTQNSNLKSKIILIAGGADKKLEYAEWAKVAKRYCKAIIFLPGTATDKMKNAMKTTHYQLPTTHSMSAAVPPRVNYCKRRHHPSFPGSRLDCSK